MGRSCSSWCHAQQRAQRLQFIRNINLCSKQKLRVHYPPTCYLHAFNTCAILDQIFPEKKRTTQINFLTMTEDEARGPLLTSLHTLQPKQMHPLHHKHSKFSCLSPVPEMLSPQHPSLPSSWLGSGTRTAACTHSAWAICRAGERQALNLCNFWTW